MRQPPPGICRTDRPGFGVAALARHRGALDRASDRLTRANSRADRLEALRGLETSLAEIGRFIGDARRAADLHHRSYGTKDTP